MKLFSISVTVANHPDDAMSSRSDAGGLRVSLVLVVGWRTLLCGDWCHLALWTNI